MTELPRRIERALRGVVDPEMGRDVVTLGLIYDIAVARDGIVGIVMTTTVRGCPLSAFLKQAVAAAAEAVPGVEAVEVTLTWEPPWSPAMIASG